MIPPFLSHTQVLSQSQGIGLQEARDREEEIQRDVIRSRGALASSRGRQQAADQQRPVGAVMQAVAEVPLPTNRDKEWWVYDRGGQSS